MKWALKFQMALYVTLLWWVVRGTNWYLIFHFSLIRRLYSALSLLSSICRSPRSWWSRRRCIILLLAWRPWLSFLVLNLTPSIILASQWYAIMNYWCPLWAQTGERPVLSVYNLLMGATWRKSSLDLTWGSSSSGEISWGGSGELGWGGLGLVDLTPWRFWTRCPMMVALVEGQYLVVLVRVRPGHND